MTLNDKKNQVYIFGAHFMLLAKLLMLDRLSRECCLCSCSTDGSLELDESLCHINPLKATLRCFPSLLLCHVPFIVSLDASP